MPDADDALEIDRGMKAITRFFKLQNERKAFHLAAKGLLPGVYKEGRGYALNKKVAREESERRAREGVKHAS